MNTPFKLKSGNSPLYKMLGGSPLQHRKRDIHGRKMKHKHRGGGQAKTRVGRFFQRLFGKKEKSLRDHVMP